MTEQDLKLVGLDPNKQYVIMFKGDPGKFKWPDKPANVSPMLLNADRFTIEDLDKAKAALDEERS